jgi:hypothetical protein
MSTYSFQIIALKNQDRVRLLSTLALIEAQLRARWIETIFNPHVVIADVDQHEGLSAVKAAITNGIQTIALSEQPMSLAHHTLKHPVTAKELLHVLNSLEERLLKPSISGQHRIVPKPEAQLLRKAHSLLEYLAQNEPSGIVEVRLGLGRSIMFNHNLKSYCSVLPLAALLASANLPIQEVAHGNGQAEAEWRLATKVLSPRPIEDLAWQMAIANADLQPKKQVLQAKLHLLRVPQTTAGLSRAQLSMASALKHKILSVAELAAVAGAAREEAANFCYAAHVCKLIEFRA